MHVIVVFSSTCNGRLTEWWTNERTDGNGVCVFMIYFSYERLNVQSRSLLLVGVVNVITAVAVFFSRRIELPWTQRNATGDRQPRFRVKAEKERNTPHRQTLHTHTHTNTL
jgi:hypothetical protein